MTQRLPDRPPPEGGILVYAAILSLFLIAAIMISLGANQIVQYAIHCYKEYHG